MGPLLFCSMEENGENKSECMCACKGNTVTYLLPIGLCCLA